MTTKRHLSAIVLLAALFLLGLGVRSSQSQTRAETPDRLVTRLAERVVSLELDSGLESSLLAQLRAARKAFERGDSDAGIGSLRAFQNHVRARRGIHTGIFIYDANALSAQAEVIVNVAEQLGALIEGQKLLYMGGSIIAHPKVYLIFWGLEWQDLNIDQADANVYGFLPGFLEKIGGTVYLDTLMQYYQENPDGSRTYTSNDGDILKGIWIDPQPYPKDATLTQFLVDGSTNIVFDLTTEHVQKEVLRAVNHFGYDPDAIYFVITDSKRYWQVEKTKALAYHSSFKAPPLAQSVVYAELPYEGVRAAAKNLHDTYPLTKDNWTLSHASAVSLLAFHEVAEAINDPRYGDSPASAAPFPSNYGWVSFWNLEVADRCGDIWANPPAVFSVGLVPFLVPQLWSNAAFGCVQFP